MQDRREPHRRQRQHGILLEVPGPAEVLDRDTISANTGEGIQIDGSDATIARKNVRARTGS
jgi:hypothetical protein